MVARVGRMEPFFSNIFQDLFDRLTMRFLHHYKSTMIPGCVICFLRRDAVYEISKFRLS